MKPHRAFTLSVVLLLAACGTFEAGIEPAPVGGTPTPARPVESTNFEAQVAATATALRLAAISPSASSLTATSPLAATATPAAPSTAGPAAVPTSTATACGVRSDWPIYTVQPGDTLSQLAARAGVSVDDLVRANCLTSTDIWAGQLLSVPTSLATPKPPVTAPPTSAAASATPPQAITPQAHVPAVIHMLHASPFQNLKPGDSVTVVWEAEGNNATICQLPGEGTGPTDCVAVPMRGERQFTVRNTNLPYRLTLYINMAPQDFQHAEQLDGANLFVGCQYEWFFDQPEVPLCPISAPQVGRFAAQQFERGWLLWARPPGRYIGLVDKPLGASYEKTLLTTSDPLNILRDTSAGVVAPQGFFAPVSGFGIVWRGDAEYTQGYGEALGWGLAPEIGYNGGYQCDASISRWQFCYVQHPEGAVVVLHPNYYWYYLGEGRP